MWVCLYVTGCVCYFTPYSKRNVLTISMCCLCLGWSLWMKVWMFIWRSSNPEPNACGSFLNPCGRLTVWAWHDICWGMWQTELCIIVTTDKVCVCVFTLQVFGQFCYLGTLCPFVREKEMCMYARERDLIIQQSYNWLSLTSENQLWITLSAQNVQHQCVRAMDWKTLNLKSNPIKGTVQENGKSLLLILMSFQTNIILFFHGTHTKMYLYIIVCVFHWKDDSMYRFGMTCWLNNEVFHQEPNSPVWRKNKKIKNRPHSKHNWLGASSECCDWLMCRQQ